MWFDEIDKHTYVEAEIVQPLEDEGRDFLRGQLATVGSIEPPVRVPHLSLDEVDDIKRRDGGRTLRHRSDQH